MGYGAAEICDVIQNGGLFVAFHVIFAGKKGKKGISLTNYLTSFYFQSHISS